MVIPMDQLARQIPGSKEPVIIGQGSAEVCLSEADISTLVRQAFEVWDLTGKRVLVIIPDGTRNAPIPLFFRLINQALLNRAAALDYLIALGTHPAMDPPAIARRLGVPSAAFKGSHPQTQLFQHPYTDPDALITTDILPPEEVAILTQDRILVVVPVTVNKMLLEYDQLLICGPVFPHEAAGFSGGNKYLFPGVSGVQMIDLIHWLGALETNLKIVGTKSALTRRVIERAAACIDRPKLAFCLVTNGNDLAGLYIGDPIPAWSQAADLSARVHVRYIDRPCRQVLAVIPEMYTDLWTAAKGVLKVEPAVADGGEVVIYAPHIDELSYSHGELVDQIGYHVRDYYLAHWERFKHIPGRVLSHSTLVRGSGTYKGGVEAARIRVTLATKIPRERCERLLLGYRDPATIDPANWVGREQDGILLVPQAGEILYRILRDKTH